jgi:hypothetical protein
MLKLHLSECFFMHKYDLFPVPVLFISNYYHICMKYNSIIAKTEHCE